jgi:phage tail-like protein
MAPSKEFLAGSRFFLQIDGIEIAVKSVDGAKMENQQTEMIVGNSGPGKRVDLPMPTVPSGGKLTITTFVAQGEKKLYDWYEKCCPDQGASQVMSNLKDIGLIASLANDSKSMEIKLVECYPCNYTIGTVDASANEFLTEVVEVVYHRMDVV